MTIRGTGAFLATAALLFVLCPGTAPAASADAAAHAVTALQCQGTESDVYTPGVTFQPRLFTITITGRLISCVDAAGQVSSGSYGPEQVAVYAGCDDLFDAFHGSRTFVWNTGDASVLEGSGQSTEVAGQVVTTFTGTIVQGRFQGQSAIQTITLPQPSALQCLTTGYTGATGIDTLTIS